MYCGVGILKEGKGLERTYGNSILENKQFTPTIIQITMMFYFLLTMSMLL